jgi:phytoene synthase
MDTIEFTDTRAALPCRDRLNQGISLAGEAVIARHAEDAGEPFGRAIHLLPSSRLRALEALYILRRELRDITQSAASRALKLALLADWRTEIARLYAGPPAHLAMDALRDAIERYDLRCDDFLAIIAGTEMDVRSDIRAPVLAELDLYCERSAVAVCRVAFQIMGARAPASQPLAVGLGRGMQLAGILRDLTRDATRQRLYLPREILRAHGIVATMPAYVLAQPALHRACDDVVDLAEAYFIDAEHAPPASPTLGRADCQGDASRLPGAPRRAAGTRLDAARRTGALPSLEQAGAEDRRHAGSALIHPCRRFVVSRGTPYCR